jgi:hypothetical protein
VLLPDLERPASPVMVPLSELILTSDNNVAPFDATPLIPSSVTERSDDELVKRDRGGRVISLLRLLRISESAAAVVASPLVPN